MITQKKNRIKQIVIVFFLIFFSEIIGNYKLYNFISRTFLININSNFSKTILGDIVFKYKDDYFTIVDFNKDGYSEPRKIKEVIDIKSFRKIQNEGSHIHFRDQNNEYLLLETSDELIFAGYPNHKKK